MQVQPYLFFNGRCEEALQFYGKTIGAKVQMMMHACFRVGETDVMASDGMCVGKPAFEGFSLSLTARDDADAKRLFGALSDGGKVQMPLGPSFFASSFGMLTDRFGVGWMVIAPKAQP